MEVQHRPAKAVYLPDEDGIKLVLGRVLHEAVEFRGLAPGPCFGCVYPVVAIFLQDFPAAALAVFAEFPALNFTPLIRRTNP